MTLKGCGINRVRTKYAKNLQLSVPKIARMERHQGLKKKKRVFFSFRSVILNDCGEIKILTQNPYFWPIKSCKNITYITNSQVQFKFKILWIELK